MMMNINIGRLQSKCVDRIFKAQDIRTYHFPEKRESGEEVFGIGLEVLPIMGKDTQLGKFLQRHFKAIMISKERMSQVADLLRTNKDLLFNLLTITHIYTDTPYDQATKDKLLKGAESVESTTRWTRTSFAGR